MVLGEFLYRTIKKRLVYENKFVILQHKTLIHQDNKNHLIMKKLWIGIGILVAGVTLFIMPIIIAANTNAALKDGNFRYIPGTVFFINNDYTIDCDSLQITKPIKKGVAFAKMLDSPFDFDGIKRTMPLPEEFDTSMVLFWDDKESELCEGKIVKRSEGKCLKAVGTYKYKTGFFTTISIPIAAFVDE